MPKTTPCNILKTLTCIVLASTSAVSTADTLGPFTIVESRPMSELWLNPGFYTYHFQKDRGFNNNNLGLGGEYRYSTTSSITVGDFHNSDWQRSRYIGWYWHPLAWGSVCFGAAVAGMDGYPKMNNGSWFPAVIPAASFEYKGFGANMLFVPSYPNKLHGGLSLQLKMKAY